MNDATFLLQLQYIIKNTAPTLCVETLPTGKDSFITVIKNKTLNDLGLVIDHDLVSIVIGWNQVESLNCDCSAYDNYITARFLEYEDNAWQKLALNYIKTNLKRPIFIFISYLQKKTIKIRYAIKLDDGQYKTIATKRLTKRTLFGIFQIKEEKMFETTLMENNFFVC